MKYPVIEEIRRKNARLIRDSLSVAPDSDVAGSNNMMAQLMDLTPGYLSQIIGDKGRGKIKSIGSEMARKIEICFNKPLGWMDNTHKGILPERLYQALLDAKELRKELGESEDDLRALAITAATLYDK